MSHKKKKNSNRIINKNKRNSNNRLDNDKSDNKNTENDKNELTSNEISSGDLESLRLLGLQLRGILLDYLGDSLLWDSTMQGISYILEKYDNIEGNEHSTTLVPDIVSLQASYTFLAAKLISTNIAFTRFNIVSRKKAEGTFEFSLLPNYFINIANVLNLIVSYYFINASIGIVARDNNQPVFGNI